MGGQTNSQGAPGWWKHYMYYIWICLDSFGWLNPSLFKRLHRDTPDFGWTDVPHFAEHRTSISNDDRPWKSIGCNCSKPLPDLS